jgi:hypothetical protein
MDPADATGHHRLEQTCDWSIAHGAVTQLTDHIILIPPRPHQSRPCGLAEMQRSDKTDHIPRSRLGK